ncbi:MAG: Hsp20/alpha crystallin family protein [Candidatus Jettenia sp. CY-1]|nr:MAG: Hsp20/alpha crystallin family protein [Candidatus Jettenia sp.]WKZ18823.1 MAG: Hsp20/alpha crystallin family protein [Candidatus Jettenia sp. CY-1]
MSPITKKLSYLPLLNAFRNEMNKLLSNFQEGDIIVGTGLMPPLDVSEDDKGIMIKMEVPGIEPKDINISIIGNTLTIQGEKRVDKEEKEKNYHLLERCCGYFSRSVALPASVKFHQVKAEYKKGILEIILPKCEKSGIKKIPVKGG